MATSHHPSTHCPFYALINPSCFQLSHLTDRPFRVHKMQNKSTPLTLETFKPLNLMKLSETAFPLAIDQPVNLRIMLHAASSQMSSTRLRKVLY